MSKFRFLKKGDNITVTDDIVAQAAMKGISLSESFIDFILETTFFQTEETPFV